MTLTFRNVDATPSDPVRTWPFEALVTALERGLVADWQPIFAEIKARPWGSVARSVESYLSYAESVGIVPLMTLAIERARESAERDERGEVASRVRGAIARSGRTAAEFAREAGTSPSRLSTYASGKVTPSAALLLRIERVADLAQ